MCNPTHTPAIRTLSPHQFHVQPSHSSCISHLPLILHAYRSHLPRVTLCRQYSFRVLRDTREILNHRLKEEEKSQQPGEGGATKGKGSAAAAAAAAGENATQEASGDSDADAKAAAEAAAEARAYREPSLSTELLRARLDSTANERERLGKVLHSDIVRLAASGLLPEVTGQVCRERGSSRSVQVG